MFVLLEHRALHNLSVVLYTPSPTYNLSLIGATGYIGLGGNAVNPNFINAVQPCALQGYGLELEVEEFGYINGY